MIQKKLVSILVSIVIGILFALVINESLYSLGLSFPSLLLMAILFPLKISIYSSLFAIVLSSGYAGFKIPKYFEDEGYDLMKVSKAHSLAFNTIFWLSYIVIFYTSNSVWATSSFGIFLAMFAFPVCLVIFPYSISYLTVYTLAKIYPDKS